MQPGWAFAAVAIILVAGCAQPATEAPTTSSTTRATSSAPPAGRIDFAWTPAVPMANQTVAFSVKGQVYTPVKEYAWDFGDGGTSAVGAAQHAFAAGNHTVTLRVTDQRSTVTATHVVRVVPSNLTGGPEPVPDPEGNTTADPEERPRELSCAGKTIVEKHATFGQAPDLPGLTWAVLKTGNRLAVAWTSSSATTGSITYSIDGGSPTTVAETVPTAAHLLVVDGLSGDTVCFTATEGATTTPLHAALLRNAMTDYDPELGVYTLNQLVLVDEGGDLGEVEEGADVYARMLWDSTDGHVRSGATIIVVNRFNDPNLGWPPCYLLGGPVCRHIYDVLFTNVAGPQGAASTYRQGIRDPAAAIWMNQYHQAMPGPISMDDTGSVWLHEMGHYAFDMDDLYGDNTVVTSECFDAGTGISIMAGSREAREFDDPVAPCPNQPAGYATSWELLQGQFDRVPDRPDGPVKGPEGNGGAHVRATFVGP